MPDTNDVLRAFRRELISAGLVRHPSVDAMPPPLVLEPEGGARSPGDRNDVEDDPNLVITAVLGGDVAEGPTTAFRRRTVITVRYRSAGTTGLVSGRELDAAIRARVAGRLDYGLGWTMGETIDEPGIVVLSSAVFAGLSPIPREPGQGFDEAARYVFEVEAD